MTWETVSLNYDDEVATLTVDRPEALNSLNVETLEAMDGALTEVEAEGVRALVVTGAGEKAFVAGADIAHMSELDSDEAQAYADLGHGVMDAVETFPAPAVAAINGYAFGGGLELAMACDLRIAGAGALVGQPEIDLGVIPGFGGTQRLPELVGDEYARRLIYTGERIDAETAHEHGLVGEVVDDAKARAAEVAAELAEQPAFALRAAKEAINRAGGDREGGLAFERRAFASLAGSPDQREGMAAFLEDREPEFE
ncbi:MAG: enoyl-CoA hydratase-related protein [Haloarculaceae archaeon]